MSVSTKLRRSGGRESERGTLVKTDTRPTASQHPLKPVTTLSFVHLKPSSSRMAVQTHPTHPSAAPAPNSHNKWIFVRQTSTVLTAATNQVGQWRNS